MSRSLNMNLYLRAFSIAIYQKVLFVLFVPIQTFFWSANCTILVCKSCSLFQTILDLWPMLILEIFSSWDIKCQFQFLITFLAVVSGLQIVQIRSVYHHIIKRGQCFNWGFLVFSILVLSVLKYLKFVFSKNFSWSGNVKVLICKLYMPGL